jgi:hypothetical protein
MSEVHTCEIERAGKICGKPATAQSLFAMTIEEGAARLSWVCDEHGEGLRSFAASLPVDPSDDDEEQKS